MADFLPEPVELSFAQTAFEEGARVDAGGGVALEENLIAREPPADRCRSCP